MFLNPKIKLVCGLLVLASVAVLYAMFLFLIVNADPGPSRRPLSPEAKRVAKVVSGAIVAGIVAGAVLYLMRCLRLLASPKTAGRLTRLPLRTPDTYQLELFPPDATVLQVRLWQIGRDHGDLSVLAWINGRHTWGVLAGPSCVWLPRPAFRWNAR
jgi:hypothetical protein